MEELEERLSRPSAEVVEAIRTCAGDIAILGAGGKMGLSTARMVRRAANDAGLKCRVLAVSRFSSADTPAQLRTAGVEVIAADLSDPEVVEGLPDASDVLFLAGQKFGTTSAPGSTWSTNVVVPALAARRYSAARFVALSSGNVYGRTAPQSGGSTETDRPDPVGEYAWSCLARERVLEHASRSNGMALSIVRLNYAVDLRYGVLVDIALKVQGGQSIDLGMGYVNVIWQGDACARAIRCLTLASSPPFVVNVTGDEVLSVKEVAGELGGLLGREPRFTGSAASDALLSDASKARSLFGKPAVDSTQLISWVAGWVRSGGATLGKPTHFEEREGAY